MSDNILSRIPGPYIADALQTIPPAERASDGLVMETVVEVPGVGRVRFTARCMSSKRGRSTHHFWTAESGPVVA